MYGDAGNETRGVAWPLARRGPAGEGAAPREEAAQAAMDGRAEGFTVEDVQKALRAFASSHSVAARWLRKVLRLKKEEPLEEELDLLTETFCTTMGRPGAGYAPALLAVLAVVYHVVPSLW